MSEVYLLMFGEAFSFAHSENEEFFDTVYGVPLAVFSSRNDALEFLNRLIQTLKRVAAGEDYQAVAEEAGLPVSRAKALLGIAVLLGSSIIDSRFNLLKYEGGKFTFEALEPVEEQQPLHQGSMLA